MRGLVCAAAMPLFLGLAAVVYLGSAAPRSAGGTDDPHAARLARAQELIDRLRAGAGIAAQPDQAPPTGGESSSDLLELQRLAAEHAGRPTAAAATADAAGPWSDEFADAGPPGAITAATFYQSSLIVAGTFAQSGARAMNNVGRWSAGEWTPMGAGFPRGTVRAFFERNGQLYAAGSFTLRSFGTGESWDFTALASWNGQAWVAVPGAEYSIVTDPAPGNGGSLLFYHSYSGGGGAVLMWNGIDWLWSDTSVETCSGCRADQLVRLGGWAYVAGSFTSFGGKPLVNIARVRLLTSSVGAAFAVGEGLDGQVHDLAVFEGNVIAAGAFSHSGPLGLLHVARWDGTQWHPMGAGLDGVVRTLAIHRGRLIAAGDFQRSGVTNIRHLAVWDGQRWSEYAGGFVQGPASLHVAGDMLLAAGHPLLAADSSPSGVLRRWDGARWRRFGMGFDRPVRALAVADDQLYAAGAFHNAGYSRNSHFARWNGTDWDGGLAGTSSAVNAVTVWDGAVCVAGTAVGSGPGGADPWRRVARLQGNGLVPLGYGPDGEVQCLLSTGRALVAGGAFTATGQGTARHIAQWGGTQWSPLGEGLDGNVHTLGAFDGSIVAGGEFEHAGNIAAHNVAAWDGSQWRPLGPGLDGRVECLAVFRGQLYAGGHLGAAATSAMRGIARWNGTAWEPVAGGLDGIVLTLKPIGDLLVAGGWFAPTAELGGANLALFDGSRWRGVGSDLDGWVDDVVMFRDRLHVAGGFTRAGEVPSRSIARLEQDLDPASDPPRPHQLESISGGWPVPNPFNPATTASFTTTTEGRVQVRVFDVRGRLVKTLLDETRGPGRYEVQWNGRDSGGIPAASGSYVLRFELDGRALNRKLVMLQ